MAPGPRDVLEGVASWLGRQDSPGGGLEAAWEPPGPWPFCVGVVGSAASGWGGGRAEGSREGQELGTWQSWSPGLRGWPGTLLLPASTAEPGPGLAPAPRRPSHCSAELSRVTACVDVGTVRKSPLSPREPSGPGRGPASSGRPGLPPPCACPVRAPCPGLAHPALHPTLPDPGGALPRPLSSGRRVTAALGIRITVARWLPASLLGEDRGPPGTGRLPGTRGFVWRHLGLHTGGQPRRPEQPDPEPTRPPLRVRWTPASVRPGRGHGRVSGL